MEPSTDIISLLAIIVFTTVAFTAAAELQVDVKPFLMAIAHTASARFMTPMGYQTHAMVFSLGNYQFNDYLKNGAPPTLVFWPFHS